MQQELKYLMGKLLNSRTGKWRAGIGSIGLWISAVLLLAAVQLQSNFSYLLNKENVGDADTTYLVINRQLNSNNLNNTTLKEEEIEQLRKLPEVAAVGTVQPAYFKAILSINNSQFPFQTDASFETVPANFIDQLPPNWDWKEGDEIVPIILPSLYLDLYNFQFALAQQLPQLSPEIIKMLTFNIAIIGSGESILLKGRVVGLSDRIQSLLVPASFMDWANQRYATENKRKPSRVIIKTNDASSPNLNQFLQKNQLRTNQEKTRFSQYRQVVNWVAATIFVQKILPPTSRHGHSCAAYHIYFAMDAATSIGKTSHLSSSFHIYLYFRYRFFTAIGHRTYEPEGHPNNYSVKVRKVVSQFYFVILSTHEETSDHWYHCMLDHLVDHTYIR